MPSERELSCTHEEGERALQAATNLCRCLAEKTGIVTSLDLLNAAIRRLLETVNAVNKLMDRRTSSEEIAGTAMLIQDNYTKVLWLASRCRVIQIKNDIEKIAECLTDIELLFKNAYDLL